MTANRSYLSMNREIDTWAHSRRFVNIGLYSLSRNLAVGTSRISSRNWRSVNTVCPKSTSLERQRAREDICCERQSCRGGYVDRNTQIDRGVPNRPNEHRMGTKKRLERSLVLNRKEDAHASCGSIGPRCGHAAGLYLRPGCLIASAPPRSSPSVLPPPLLRCTFDV